MLIRTESQEYEYKRYFGAHIDKQAEYRCWVISEGIDQGCSAPKTLKSSASDRIKNLHRNIDKVGWSD